MTGMRIVPAGDSALIVELPPRIDPAISAQVVTLGRAIRKRCAAAVRDVVVGYCSLTVYFDALTTDVGSLESELRAIASALSPSDTIVGAHIEVPVCYGGEYGPDLAEVAAFARMSPDEVIALHTSRPYRVYVVGFVPGFPYMASVDPRLALPRRATPRTRVPAGSVAVAAGQTGIYPMETPGGWHVIGQTRVKPYDPARPLPFLFHPGDEVQFHAVDAREFSQSF